MKKRYVFFVVLLISILGVACQQSNKTTDDSSQLLATVFEKKLYLSSLDGMLPRDATAEDSAIIINAYVDRWVKDALLQREAERSIPKDLNIDNLVRDYRASLVQHNYEEALISEGLNATVSQEELNAFYEKNKEQYQLDKPIVQCRFIKIKLPVEKPNELRLLWNSDEPEKQEELLSFCEKQAEMYILGDSLWYKLEDISKEMPAGTLTTQNIRYRKEFTQKDSDYQYFFELLNVKNKKEIAPLAYIEKQARKVILHNRKIKLIEEAKIGLYEKEKRLGNVSIYFK